MYFFKKSVITRIPPGEEPRKNDPRREAYLVRWTVFGCGWFTIKVHKIQLPDEACLHDHPWSFLSLILWGGYWEETFESSALPGYMREFSGKYGGYPEPYAPATKKKWYRPGSLLWRPHGVAHRLDLKMADGYREFPGWQPCYTLVITFRRRSEWGFFTPKRWVPHGTYVATNTCE